MSKKRRGRHRSGGRVTPKGTRPSGNRPMHFDDPFGFDIDEPTPAEAHPFSDLAHALRADHPLDLLAMASGLLLVTKPRRTTPFGEEPPTVPFDEFLSTLLEHDDPATTALLGAFAVLADDEVSRRRCAREVAARRWSTADWFHVLDVAEVTRTVESTEDLRDGDNVYLEVMWPTGHVMTVVVYVDHNMGSLTKDVFAIPMALDEMRVAMQEHLAEEGLTFADVDAAESRARIEDALRTYEMTWPQPESDTWPAARPLLDWALTLLPEGGEWPGPKLWDEHEMDAVADAFLSSPYAAALDREDEDLVEAVVWYGTGYGNADPYRWGVPRVEIFLADWAPRKVVAPYDSLRRVPAVVRAFILWAHEQAHIPPERTIDVIRAIEEWEPVYLDAIADDDRPRGPQAILDALGLFGNDHDFDEDEPDWWTDDAARFRELAIEAVGDAETLDVLDAAPLPDEPLDLSAVPDDIADRVRRVAELTDGVCDDFFGDVELRTACRRFLADVAVGDPAIFRRRSKDNTAAAAVCWVVAKANRELPHGESGPMLASLGVSGSVGQRAQPMVAAVGAPRFSSYNAHLSDPRYLTSSERARLIEWRDRY